MGLIRDDISILDSPVSYFDNRSDYWNSLNTRNSDPLFVPLIQYGSPHVAAENADFTNFNANLTLQRLKDNGMGSSLQSQVLERGGLARLFSIQRFSAELNSNPQRVTQYFYNQTLMLIQVNLFYLISSII